MKKILIIMAVIGIMLVGASNVVADTSSCTDNKFVTELKNWEWSLGGMAYLKKADNYYYACGAKRDLGPFFNWLPNERIYGEVGYLNTYMVNNNSDNPFEKQFGYIGLSTNANFLAQSAISGLNTVLNANLTTPEILNKVLATIGMVGAKRMDSTFWSIDTGYDYGAIVSIINLKW